MSNQLSDKINRRLLDKFNLAYILVDQNLSVLEASENVADYGFPLPSPGDDVTESVDVLVGLDLSEELFLPMVSSPGGLPVSISLLPNNDKMTVVFADAREQFDQRQQVQQKANENQVLLDQQRKLMSELGSAQDLLTERNEQLKDASRLQTGFLSGVSHEFRTPLTSILGYSNLLRKSVGDENQTGIAYIDAVRRSGKHLLSLVENLLDHGKLDAGDITIYPQVVDLAALCDDVAVVLKPLAETKRINFEVRSKLTSGACVLIDDSRLRQCLINLIGNAIKFTDIGSVDVMCEYQNDHLIIEIQDTGIGIRAKDIDELTQPFWQAEDTGKAGTGLGLTITDRIVDMMGGSMSISSEFGEGTSVTLSLPAALVELDLRDEAIRPSKFSRPISILLAEDDQDIANLVSILLREADSQVFCVENGELALAALKENSFDLVLMDFHMPVLDGYRTIEKIRDSGNLIPIVVMTASAIEVDRKRAEELGCNGYLVKPVGVEDIIEIANQVIPESS